MEFIFHTLWHARISMCAGGKTKKLENLVKHWINFISPRLRLYETHSGYTVNIMRYCLLDSNVQSFDTATWKIICNCYSHLPVCLLLDRYYDPDLILPVILKCDPISVRELRRELLRKLQNLLLPFWAHWYSQARQSLIINSATSKQTNGSFIHFLAFLYCYIVYFIYFILSFTLG